jgi:hypothetical protein
MPKRRARYALVGPAVADIISKEGGMTTGILLRTASPPSNLTLAVCAPAHFQLLCPEC